jgi:phosphoribosylanthranilate isomerase
VSGLVRIKVCCIQSVNEAARAVAAGASAVGLVAAMPSGPGPISEDEIVRIAPTVPPGVATFLLTSETSASAIVGQQRRCRTNTVQLCDHLGPEVHAALRAALPGIGLVQVVHVTGEESLAYALSISSGVDALLLDSGRLDQSVRELGGTGRTHDWSVSRRIREQCGRPVWLAGGLKPGNVTEAIRAVEPFGVDLCSGIRNEGWLDDGKLEQFVRAVESVRGSP